MTYKVIRKTNLTHGGVQEYDYERFIRYMGRVMTKKISISPDAQKKLKAFADGLGVTYDEAIMFLLTKVVGDENLKAAGHRLRVELDPEFTEGESDDK